MAACEDLIRASIEPDCADQIVSGIEPNGVIINRADIDSYEFDATRKNVIKAVTLKSGSKAYKIYVPSNAPFNNTQTTFEVGANRNSFTNDLAFAILKNDPDVCEQVIDGLANGTFVVIFENKYKNINATTNPGDSTFQLMGYYQGMRATTLENNKYSEDTDGGWGVVLQETKVPKSALFVYDTSLEVTRAMIESLTT
jgi:hypothetical protein